MTDREMLELAAKAAAAAGMNIIDSEAGPQIFERHASDGSECYRIWRPREDDGDALRLAVKLRMTVDVHLWSDSVQVRAYAEPSMYHIDEEGDPYAATRSAIVRAAAEIGKGMKGDK